MTYVVCNPRVTRYMLPSGRWTSRCSEAAPFKDMKSAVRDGLRRGHRTFIVLPATDGSDR